MCPHVMELMFKIHEISRFYYAFIISRFSLYSLFYILFKFFNFLTILKYNFIVYLYSFSAVFFITQNITHKNILLYYGHSPIFSPFSFNLNVLTLPSPSTLDNTLSTSLSCNAFSILLANFLSLSTAFNILLFSVDAPVNQSSDLCFPSFVFPN